MLARELGFEIVEWRNGADERFARSDDGGEWGWDEEYEGLADKFRTFLARASSCRSVLAPPRTPATSPSQSQARSSTQSSSATASSQSKLRPSQSEPQLSASSASSTASSKPAAQDRQQVILLEDLPNILHAGTQAAFHAALEAFVALPSGAPLVLIISDAGLRGEDAEADGGGWRARSREAVDVRSALPPGLLNSPYVTQIGCAPPSLPLLPCTSSRF